MGVENAVEAVRRLRPRWVIPSHWGSPSEGGTAVDVRLFVERVGELAELVLPEHLR
jgi:L-ascorbate metabolism protein UlaG (beta-lactamase superfamily)